MAEAVRFQVGPLTIPIAADAFEAWVDQAGEGDRLPYARGPEPLRAHPTFLLAARLVAQKRITTFQPRVPGTRLFDFVAERLAIGFVPAPVDVEVLDILDRRVLGEIRAVIAAGSAWPGDASAARRLQLKNADAVRYRRERLAGLGVIRWVNRGPLLPLVITDLETGKCTAEAR
ncbi:hypothetical protein [Sphingomonas sp. OTU376]|uniref:hypothetical protein n=1 Tax=Sphingomonas sp. OTU376 TaxID=3043863 RepID=UPI00313C4696